MSFGRTDHFPGEVKGGVKCVLSVRFKSLCRLKPLDTARGIRAVPHKLRGHLTCRLYSYACIAAVASLPSSHKGS